MYLYFNLIKMNAIVILLIYAISFCSPLVAVAARKELSDAAKAWLILYGLAMFMFATIAVFTGASLA